MLQESHVRGSESEPLLNDTVDAVLQRTIERFGAREALVSVQEGVRWTYAELGQRVEALAAGLIAMGLQRGDRLGIWSPNRSEWLTTQLATARVGIILVNINPAYRTYELEYALHKVGCRALILAPRFKTSDYEALITEIAPEISDCEPGELRAARLPELRWVVTLGESAPRGFARYADLEHRATPKHRAQATAIANELNPHDPINIQFTSGTTGLPKGATLSHHNIVNNAYFVGRAMRLSESDRLAIPVPLYHCFGMVMGNLGCITHGATMVYPSESFEPRRVLEAVAGEQCTALYGVPTMFVAVLSDPDLDRFDCRSLRTGIMAGSPCPLEVMRRVIDRLHMSEVTIAYGMTETSPVSMQSTPDDSVERRVSTVGRIHPHLEVKIVDADGQTTPVGEPGELCTRGYSIMKGYWNDEERTREAIDAEGWMHTGDLATLDEEGYCNIVGRLKDMVIRGGENIYPREIEEFLHTHPGIQDVQVFGVPDPKYGEELAAWLIATPGATLAPDAVREHCRGKIAHFKIPRYIRCVDEFPTTVTGKPQKYLMRKAMTEELGLSETQTA